VAQFRAFRFDENHGAKFDDRFAALAPPGQFRPNLFGLFDMHGNVAEWCLDSYREDYQKLETDDPVCQEPLKERVFRGGSWRSTPWGANSYRRDFKPPEYAGDELGFRVLRVVPDPRVR
jgi:formylglycine-generating enzyme required for sulfatase activity